MKHSMVFLALAGGLASTGCFSFGMSMSASDPPPPPAAPEEPPAVAADQSPPDQVAESVCEVGELAACAGRCNDGEALSCNNLGAMYEMGSGVDADMARALEFYDKACAGGADGGCQNGVRLRNMPAPTAAPTPAPAPAATLNGAASWGL